jgi:hypothetical protein
MKLFAISVVFCVIARRLALLILVAAEQRTATLHLHVGRWVLRVREVGAGLGTLLQKQTRNPSHGES